MRIQAGRIIHNAKKYAGMGGADNIAVGQGGMLFNSVTGDIIGFADDFI